MSTLHNVKDSSGREIVFKELDVFDYSEFLLALGSSASGNAEYKQLAQFAYSLISIDGSHKLTPKTLDQIKANVKHLDTAGYNAIMAYLVARASEGSETEIPDPEADKAVPKKLVEVLRDVSILRRHGWTRDEIRDMHPLMQQALVILAYEQTPDYAVKFDFNSMTFQSLVKS